MSRIMNREQGLTMIEVLMTIFVVAVGLLGLAALQSKMMVAQFESYQRAQAATILRDIVSRLHANGAQAADYVTTAPVGTEQGLRDCTGLTRAALDICEWNNALVGAAEQRAGNNVGAMVGARGCISLVNATPPQRLTVAVVWQGMSETAVPGATTCGSGEYDNETKRRAITAQVTIACFENDPATGACIPR